jgi:hypothetical protein
MLLSLKSSAVFWLHIALTFILVSAYKTFVNFASWFHLLVVINQSAMRFHYVKRFMLPPVLSAMSRRISPLAASQLQPIHNNERKIKPPSALLREFGRSKALFNHNPSQAIEASSAIPKNSSVQLTRGMTRFINA